MFAIEESLATLSAAAEASRSGAASEVVGVGGHPQRPGPAVARQSKASSRAVGVDRCADASPHACAGPGRHSPPPPLLSSPPPSRAGRAIRHGAGFVQHAHPISVIPLTANGIYTLNTLFL